MNHPTYRILVKDDWKPTYILWPRKISNRIRWLTKVYKRRVLEVRGDRNNTITRTEYCTLFDILENPDL